MIHEGTEFRLTDAFLNKYKRKHPDFGPLGEFSFSRTYARPIGKNKVERWWQTVQRVVEGAFLVQKRHCQWWSLPWNERKAQRSAQEMYRLIFEMKFLPPGRGLWSMGTPFMFEKGSACLNNCGFVTTEEIDKEFSAPFVWLMDMSMMGVGVGFDTEGADLEVYLKEPRIDPRPHVAEDSREGWVECLRRVLDAYSGSETLPLSWDLSLIRDKGEPIKGFGGIAPGSGPLREMIDKVSEVCKRYLVNDQPIDSTFIVDIMNFAGAAVVAGGIRRTAEIGFGHLDDEEFLNLKNQDAINDPNLARWASNNSVLAQVGDDYHIAATHSAVNGEPGFLWLENAQAYGRMSDGKNWRDRRARGSNPCGEQTLEPFELCNLVETFPSRHTNIAEYLHTLKYAYMYAKTVTLIPTHDPRTNAVMFRNRRIGLSQSGIIENINRIGFRNHINWCEAGYQEVKKYDEIYSDWFCVPKSIKMTTVKPSGTVSLLPGVTPGIHHPHSEYYIRRIRVSETSNLWEQYAEAGYVVEDDKYADLTKVIQFPVHEPHFARRKDEVSIWEQFELAAAMQAKWSDNQVSITITVPEHEAKDLPLALSMYEKRLKSVSFLPLRGDEVYEQAPYQSITAEQYEDMASKLSRVVLNPTGEEDRVVEKFCDGDGVCQI